MACWCNWVSTIAPRQNPPAKNVLCPTCFVIQSLKAQGQIGTQRARPAKAGRRGNPANRGYNEGLPFSHAIRCYSRTGCSSQAEDNQSLMLPAAPSIRTEKKSSRTPAIVALSIAIFFLFAVIFAQATFKLSFLQPDTSEETLIFAALSAFIFLLFLALTFVLLRTLVRLYMERRSGVMGSRLRSRMVLGALLLSLGPVIFLFLFSYGLINRSIEKWFSRPVEDVQYRTGVVASLMTDYAADNARVEAERIAATPAARKSFETGNYALVLDEFGRSEISLQDGFAFAVADSRAEASFHAPD